MESRKAGLGLEKWSDVFVYVARSKKSKGCVKFKRSLVTIPQMRRVWQQPISN